MKRFVLVCLLAALSVFSFYLFEHNNNSNFDKNKYSLTSPSSIWVIVNKQHSLQPTSYVPKSLRAVGNDQFMQNVAAKQLSKLLKAAQADGVTLTLESGYRSFEMQVKAYNSIVNGFGKDKADKESARPGYSEHQTGFAMDFGSETCKIEDCFVSTEASKWLNSNAYKYGFILRYPANKMEITGYKSEPWHYRYVSVLLTEQLHSKRNTTLEEFFSVRGGIDYN